ncbi:hypothetical protein ACW9HC_32330 [Nocardia gipuzkoensis]
MFSMVVGPVSRGCRAVRMAVFEVFRAALGTVPRRERWRIRWSGGYCPTPDDPLCVEYGAAFAEVFGPHEPCMTLMYVSGLASPALRVEIDAMAWAEN